MFVFAFCLDVEVHASCVAEALEEVEEHFGRHVANLLACEFGVVDEPWSSAEVESDLAQAVVHRQAEPVAFDATFVAESLKDCFAESDGGIFYGVMFVDMKVAFDAYVEVGARVFAYLFEHVVEEAEACGYIAFACAVEIDADVDVGLFCCSLYGGCAFAGEKEFADLVP